MKFSHQHYTPLSHFPSPLLLPCFIPLINLDVSITLFFSNKPTIVLSLQPCKPFPNGPNLSLPTKRDFPLSIWQSSSAPHCLPDHTHGSGLTSATCLTSPSSSRPFTLPQKHFAQHRNHRHAGYVDAENPKPELLQAQLPVLFLFWLRMLSQSPPHLELVPSHIRRTLLSHSFEEVGVPGASPSSLVLEPRLILSFQSANWPCTSQLTF